MATSEDQQPPNNNLMVLQSRPVKNLIYCIHTNGSFSIGKYNDDDVFAIHYNTKFKVFNPKKNKLLFTVSLTYYQYGIGAIYSKNWFIVSKSCDNAEGKNQIRVYSLKEINQMIDAGNYNMEFHIDNIKYFEPISPCLYADTSLNFSNDGNLMAICIRRSQLIIWDMRTDEPQIIKIYDVSYCDNGCHKPVRLQFSQDNKLLVLATSEPRFYIFQLHDETGKISTLNKPLKIFNFRVMFKDVEDVQFIEPTCLSISCDNKMFAIALHCSSAPSKHIFRTFYFDFNCKKQTIVMDEKCDTISSNTKNYISVYNLHLYGVCQIKFSPTNPSLIAVGTIRGCLKIFDITTSKLITNPLELNDELRKIEWSSDGTSINVYCQNMVHVIPFQTS